MDEIINTLKHANNEATDSPYWLILDPKQNMSCEIHYLASMITGPFFCREDAEEHLNARRYAFSDRAKVYCHSRYWSRKYKDSCRSLHSNRCVCPAGVGICGYGDPDTKKCSYPRR